MLTRAPGESCSVKAWKNIRKCAGNCVGLARNILVHHLTKTSLHCWSTAEAAKAVEDQDWEVHDTDEEEPAAKEEPEFPRSPSLMLTHTHTDASASTLTLTSASATYQP